MKSQQKVSVSKKREIKTYAELEKIVLTLYENGRFKDDYPFTFGFQLGDAKLVEK